MPPYALKPKTETKNTLPHMYQNQKQKTKTQHKTICWEQEKCKSSLKFKYCNLKYRKIEK